MQVSLLIWCIILALLATVVPIGVYYILRLYDNHHAADGHSRRCTYGRRRQSTMPTSQVEMIVFEEYGLLRVKPMKDGDDFCMDDVTVCEAKPVERGHAKICWIGGRGSVGVAI
jgi:hypothetical protein